MRPRTVLERGTAVHNKVLDSDELEIAGLFLKHVNEEVVYALAEPFVEDPSQVFADVG